MSEIMRNVPRAANGDPLCSYELTGKKLDFSSRIMNLSPEETPFYSMTGSESIRQTRHQWLTDVLESAVIYDNQIHGHQEAAPAVVEGSDAVMESRKSATVVGNNTQIFRKALSVTDTANMLDNYGRAKELMYQMDKASKEIKRDVEATVLNTKLSVGGRGANRLSGGYLCGFLGNCAVGTTEGPDSLVSFKEADVTAGSESGLLTLEQIQGISYEDSRNLEKRKRYNAADLDTGAVTVLPTSLVKSSSEKLDGSELSEKDIFDMTYQLYLSGSEANIIMYHPRWASAFASLQEKADIRQKTFTSSDTRFSLYVSEIIDPLGRTYTLLPNRWMPEEYVYFFNTKDWVKMVLRAPMRTPLAKTGSSEKWMIETELTIKHRHPYASGILVMKQTDV